jgi:hypothetical protein
MFTALQMLVARRGVKRIEYRSSSTRRRTPSIHPTQSASSTDCGQVIVGRPVPVLWKPTRSSEAEGVMRGQPVAPLSGRCEVHGVRTLVRHASKIRRSGAVSAPARCNPRPNATSPPCRSRTGERPSPCDESPSRPPSPVPRPTYASPPIPVRPRALRRALCRRAERMARHLAAAVGGRPVHARRGERRPMEHGRGTLDATRAQSVRAGRRACRATDPPSTGRSPPTTGSRRSRAAGATRRLPNWGYSVHVEVEGLEPDRWYFYRFRSGDATSPVGPRAHHAGGRRGDTAPVRPSRRARTSSRGSSPRSSISRANAAIS